MPDWSPLVDIIEDDHEYLFKADLPEMRKEDVKVTIENGVLYISGERKTEKEEKKRKFHRLERFFGTFERTFTVPEDADTTKIVADFHDGVLQVRLPKTPHAETTSDRSQSPITRECPAGAHWRCCAPAIKGKDISLMKTDRVLTVDEYLNERGMVPTRVEPAGCDTRQIPIAEDKDVDFQRDARSCDCDRWGHPCPRPRQR